MIESGQSWQHEAREACRAGTVPLKCIENLINEGERQPFNYTEVICVIPTLIYDYVRHFF